VADALDQGRSAFAAKAWAVAHERLARGEAGRAVRCAFWVAFELLNRGERARGGGWVARARRMLADAGEDSAEHGYLVWLTAFQAILEGDTAASRAGFERAAALGDRWASRTWPRWPARASAGS
jgi:hypothetical protein